MQKLSKLIAAAGIVAVLFITTNAKAQVTPANNWRYSFGIETGLPTGVAKLGTNFTLGGTARVQYGITNDFSLTGTVGGYHFFPKEIPGTDQRYGSYGELPIKVGVKEFFVKNIYVGAEAGPEWEKLVHGWGPTRLDLSPNVGYANEHWDFGFHYDNFSRPNDHFGMVALRLAYGFAL